MVPTRGRATVREEGEAEQRGQEVMAPDVTRTIMESNGEGKTMTMKERTRQKPKRLEGRPLMTKNTICILNIGYFMMITFLTHMVDWSSLLFRSFEIINKHSITIE